MIKSILLLVLAGGMLMGCLGGSGEAIVKTDNEPLAANRFTHHVVVDGLDEPFQLEFDQQGHVYWIERGGKVKRINESTGIVEELGMLTLYDGKAPGLIGILLDKNFEQTRQLYLYYSAAGDDGDMRLSRFSLKADGKLDMDSEVVVLEVDWEQPDSAHIGGGMVWDGEGNLYLSIGCGTTYSQYEPIHYLNKEDSSKVYDGARAAGNTNDLRGTIIRITPQSDGSYTIPEGNLFAVGTPKTRPEIYIMGDRNPWRIDVDKQTGYLHWVEVGPDAGVDSEIYGPMGYDEFEVAREAGNHGWPFVIGRNRPYNQYDYKTKTYGEPYDLQGPVNNSPNNTGLRKLPPAKPSLVAYPYGVSEEWPILGSGGRSVVGGPVFRRADFAQDAPRIFPDYFEGKWFITEYVRNWIMMVTLNEKRTEVIDIERLLPWDRLFHKHPLDMDFGPTGDLYVVEYGIRGLGRISKYKYNAGNRAPLAKAGAKKTSGAIPFELQLSSEGTIDYDGDDLTYEWVVTPVSGGQEFKLSEENPETTLEQAGRYQVKLGVADPEGTSGSDSFEIVVGNERPEVEIAITEGNRSFYFPNASISYEVQVRDPEDGSLSQRSIPGERVSLTAEYIPSGLSTAQLGQLQENGAFDPQRGLRHVQAKTLIEENHCFTCHQLDAKLVGPAFKEVAEKYMDEVAANHKLSHSIMEGSVGNWGEVPMPPQVMVPEVEAVQIANFILSLAQPEAAQNKLPLSGTYITKGHTVEKENNFGDNANRLEGFFEVPYQLGSYVFHARYSDEGSKDAEGLSLTGEDFLLLRYPLLGPETADFFSEKGITYTPGVARHPGFIVSGQRSFIGFKQLDLTGISKINIGSQTRHYNWSHFLGATFEVRLDSPDGPLVGEPYRVTPPENITASINVSSATGMHDVYIIFLNEDSGSDDALLAILGIEFEQ